MVWIFCRSGLEYAYTGNMTWNEYGGIVHVANAFREYYHLPVYHQPDATVLKWLETGSFRCVIVLLIDAMGSSILQKHLSAADFFPCHTMETITTVFPPTTSAATTAFRTGRSPSENGWLGWNQYFREKDDNIILFRNHSQYGDIVYPSGWSEKALPVSYITDELHETGISSENIWPAWQKKDNTYDAFLRRVRTAAERPEMHFIYAYWDQLDTCMHQYGPSSSKAGTMLKEIQAETGQFAACLPSDCGLLITADHSQIDVRHDFIPDEIARTFRHPPALEPRTIAFYIKDDRKEQFQKLFFQKYGADFRLYTHEEVLSQHIFGSGTPSVRFEEFIGDYLAIAVSDLQLLYGSRKYSLGDHAGGLREEAMIPVILFSKERE